MDERIRAAVPRLIAIKLKDPEAAAAEVAKAWSEGEAVLPLDPQAPAPVIAAQIARFGPDVLVSEAGEWPLPAPLETWPDTAAVLLTSGTTGEPKGVELSHSALSAAAGLVHHRLGAVQGDRWTCVLPLHHIAGFSMLVRSRELETSPEFVDPGEASSIAASKGNLISLVPTQLARCLDAAVDISRFKGILVGGAAIDSRLLDRARDSGANVVRTYGMTETAGGVVYDGAPLDGVSIRVGDTVLPGASTSGAGDISLRTPTLMTGYRTVETFDDEWFPTKDVGQIVDGRLAVLGRVDDIINTGGEKVAPREVEAAVLEHPAVRDAHVFGAPDKEWGERVVAVVVGDETQRQAVTESLRDRLARHQVPKELVFVAEIPRTANGKVDAAALKGKAPGIL